MAYAILRTDRVDYPEMRTVRVPKGKQLENGAIVKLGALEGRPEGGEVYAADELTNEKGDVYALIAHDGHKYDDREDERDFVAKEETLVRAYLLKRGEIYTISKKAHISGEVAKNDILEPKATSYQLQKCATPADGTNLVAKVLEITTWAGQESVVIEII